MIKLNQEIINHLFNLYKEVIGSREKRYPKLEDVMSSLQNSGHFEYRAGSKWSGHSKFVIETSRVYFSPNFTPKSEREKRQVEKTERLLEKKIKQYLELVNE